MRGIGTAALALVSVLGLGMTQPPAQPGKDAPKQPQLPAGHPGAPVAQNWPKAKPEDVKSIEAIIATMYKVTGGDPGQTRDWERYKSLFVPDARLVAARPGADGTATTMFLTVGNFVDANKSYFEKGGFYDKEVARRTEAYGNIAQIWSTFESRHKADDPAPYTRGINSIQLLKDGDRWWIVNIFWDLEHENTPIPEQYLKANPN